MNTKFNAQHGPTLLTKNDRQESCSRKVFESLNGRSAASSMAYGSVSSFSVQVVNAQLAKLHEQVRFTRNESAILFRAKAARIMTSAGCVFDF